MVFFGIQIPCITISRSQIPCIYCSINWIQLNPDLFKICTALLLQEDLYYPHPLVQDILWASLHKGVEPVLMRWPGKKLREKALQTAIEHIHYEDENTRYICIGPVNKVYIQAFHWYNNCAINLVF